MCEKGIPLMISGVDLITVFPLNKRAVTLNVLQHETPWETTAQCSIQLRNLTQDQSFLFTQQSSNVSENELNLQQLHFNQ